MSIVEEVLYGRWQNIEPIEEESVDVAEYTASTPVGVVVNPSIKRAKLNRHFKLLLFVAGPPD